MICSLIVRSVKEFFNQEIIIKKLIVNQYALISEKS